LDKKDIRPDGVTIQNVFARHRGSLERLLATRRHIEEGTAES